jgi:hypothetical protein
MVTRINKILPVKQNKILKIAIDRRTRPATTQIDSENKSIARVCIFFFMNDTHQVK